MATVTVSHTTTANGQEAYWIPTGTTANGDAVALNGDGKYSKITSSGLNDFDYANTTAYIDPGLFSSTTVINSVVLHVFSENADAVNAAELSIVFYEGVSGIAGQFPFDQSLSGSKPYESTLAPSSGVLEYTRTFSFNPGTHAPWTNTDLFSGGGRFGIRFNGGSADYRLHQIFLVITYDVLTGTNWWAPDLTTLTFDAGDGLPPYEFPAFDLSDWPFPYKQQAVAKPPPFTFPFSFDFKGYHFPKGTTYIWATTTNTATDTGWWESFDTFAGASNAVHNSRPKDPRSFTELGAFATVGAGTSAMGGFPGVMASSNNHLFYAPGRYTVGTDRPTIRVNDGLFDRELASLPLTSAGAIPKAVTTILAANGTVYVASFDTGTTSADWAGRVFELSLDTGVLTQLGSAFGSGQLPYALAWHAGRLWLGTHRQSSAASGKVYYFRPNIDTDWTAEVDLSANSMASVTSLLSYKGLLYVGCSAASGTFAKVLVRSTAGVYTTSDTGSGGSAAANNAFLALAEFNGNLYATFWNPDTTAVAAIRTFNNASWTTAYTGATTTLVPFLALATDSSTLLAVGGGLGYPGTLLSTPDGTAWTNLTVFLPQDSPASTALPAVGVVVR